MDKKRRSTKTALILGIVYIVVVVLSVGGLTYAFFTASVGGNERASSNIIETADLRLTFRDTQILEMEEALPGQSESKTFTVENKGNIEIEYTIDLVNVLNEFKNGDLVYSLTSTNGGVTADKEAFPEVDGTLKTATISPGVIQTYTITVLFKETGSNQNTNQRARFSAKIQINSNGQYSLVNNWYEKCNGNNSVACSIITAETATSDALVNFSYTPSGCYEGEYNYDTWKFECTNYNANQVTNGLYYTADETVETYGEDGKRVYYYRGDVDNNWVSFAGYKWRIVRSTSEGGVRLIYSGNALSNTSGIIEEYLEFNKDASTKYHAGYTYNTNSYTGVQTDSNIKKVVDAWYNGVATNGSECIDIDAYENVNCNFTDISSKVSNYSGYLSETAVYCADRTESTVGNNVYFGAYNRLYENAGRPTFACPETNSSRYTVSTSTGNGYLTYPIALLNADEAAFAGVFWNMNTENHTPYLLDNTFEDENWIGWWTMSPFNYEEDLEYDSKDSINSSIDTYSGTLNTSYSYTYNGLRPTVSLKSCVTVIGDGNGSQGNPYELTDANC